MSLLFSGFWDAGRNFNRVVGPEDKIRRNYYNIVTPLSVVLFIPALVSTILYVVYAVMYTNDLKKSNDTIRKWAGLEKGENLVDYELDLYKFYEYYKIATDGAIICLLTIIALCMIYLILKLGKNLDNQDNKIKEEKNREKFKEKKSKKE